MGIIDSPRGPSITSKTGAHTARFRTHRPETTQLANSGFSDYLYKIGIIRDIRDNFADATMPHNRGARAIPLGQGKKVGD